MNSRDIKLVSLSVIAGAGLTLLAMVTLRSRSSGEDAGNPYADEVTRLCNASGTTARRDLDELKEGISKSTSPLPGRLVDANYVKLADIIHARTDANTDLYVRCASRQIPRWDHYVDIPTPNDRKLVDYLTVVGQAIPSWDKPPPPCRSSTASGKDSAHANC